MLNLLIKHNCGNVNGSPLNQHITIYWIYVNIFVYFMLPNENGITFWK